MNEDQHITCSDRVLVRILLPIIPHWIHPNHVTFFRLLMIPVVVLVIVMKLHVLAAILFGIAAFSDAVDGALARTRNQITDMGKVLDPFVDKVLIGTVVVMLVPQYFGWILVALILFFEALLVGNAVVMHKNQNGMLQANGAGKVKMILQSSGVATLMVFIVFHIPFLLPLAQVLLYLAVVSAAISLFVYRSI